MNWIPLKDVPRDWHQKPCLLWLKGANGAAMGVVHFFEDGSMVAMASNYHGDWDVTHAAEIVPPEGEGV